MVFSVGRIKLCEFFSKEYISRSSATSNPGYKSHHIIASHKKPKAARIGKFSHDLNLSLNEIEGQVHSYM